MNYNYPTTIFRSIFAQMYKFLVEKYIWARIGQKVPYDFINQNLANVAYAKNNNLREFPENLKQLSSMLTNIWRFEAKYIIWFGM